MFDFYARERQHADHLLPLWWALTPAERGKFFSHRYIEARLLAHGIRPTLEIPRGDVPLVVASAADMKVAKQQRIIFVEHGAGQTYSVSNPSYAGGEERERVVLFLCPSNRIAALNLARYPRAVVAVVGCPLLDVLAKIHHERGKQPVVAVSFHWENVLVQESRTTFPFYEQAVLELTQHYKVLGHGHPRIMRHLERQYRSMNIEFVYEFAEVVERADVYACDNSSTLYEFAALGRPVVVLNAPWYRRDVEHGLRFWEYADVGVQVDDPKELVTSIELALQDPPHIRQRRKEIVESVYNADGSATERAIAAMRGIV